jgi:uncharacterized protein (DUF427 family)
MTLSLGTGPLAGSPAGAFNFDIAGASPAHRIYFAGDERRHRAFVGDDVVLDTIRAKLLYETGIPPRVYAPLEDFAAEFLAATDTTTHCPFKGDASYWTMRAGGRELPDVLWSYPDPVPEALWLKGYGSLYQDRVDAWFVEDDRVVGHPHDPFHRVDVHDSSRPVVVRVGGEEVARTTRPKLVFETSLPVRVYVPPADIRAGAIAAGSGLRTVCPYKGEATYWTVNGVENAAWSYELPLAECARAAGHLSFDTSIDGVEVELA